MSDPERERLIREAVARLRVAVSSVAYTEILRKLADDLEALREDGPDLDRDR